MVLTQLLNEANKQQLAAIEAPRQPILVIAGPGTGKTRTLITRIIYENEHYKIPADQILALTFSNKAADEMRHRLGQFLETEAEKVRVSTFHAFCLDILRKYHATVGLDRHFSVCDDKYQQELVKSLLINRVRENADKKARGILLAFSNYLLKDKSLPAFSVKVYEDYCKHLEKYRLIDFDQILTKTRSLFQENPDILKQYRFLFQAILVDEFQDTDPVQYEIIKMLAEKHRNIFVVADDDQSIYAWRGAHPQNIRRYMEDFTITNPIFLEQNYRNGREIVAAAQQIVKDIDRVEPGKKIEGFTGSSELKLFNFDDEGQELEFILQKIKQWCNDQLAAYSDMAIIYPRHSFGERIVTYLIKERIPHQMAAGRNLMDNPAMKKLLLYLKLIREPADPLILEELCRMELGYHVFKQIETRRSAGNLTFRKALHEAATLRELGSASNRLISTFIGHVANLINLKSFFSFEKLVIEIQKGIREIHYSILSDNISRLTSIKTDQILPGKKPNTNLWLYHSDPRISFIAQKMLTRVLPHTVRLLSKENIIHVSRDDQIILLETLNVDTLPCPYVTVFNFKTAERMGALSALFRWLQYQLHEKRESIFDQYVIFDLETTGSNSDRCGIVEIAAIKVKHGKKVDEFHRMVNPHMPIEPGAEAVHNISQAEVANQPAIESIWPDFVKFVGKDLLLAHNGYAFDFKIADRIARQSGLPKLTNLRYDTLILARQLFAEGSNSIDGLARRFNLDTGIRHRALADVKILGQIFRIMLNELETRDVKSSLEQLCEYVALANILENQLKASEDKVLLMAGMPQLLSPYSRLRKAYVKSFHIDDDELLMNLKRITEQNAVQARQYHAEAEFARQIEQMVRQFNHLPVDEAIAEFLSFTSLINPQDTLDDLDAVSLLTFHAAKGLEFDRIILVGMEDDHMPSFFAYRMDEDDDRPIQQKLEEQKRLLYVGITRARKEVIFTMVKNRFGRQQKISPFISEIEENLSV